jgi:hypothetical protein
MTELCGIPGCKFEGNFECKKNKSNTSDCEYKNNNFCGHHYKHKTHFTILEELKKQSNKQSKGANSAGGRRKRTRKHKNHRRRTHRK